MARRKNRQHKPLPQRKGIDPVRLKLPEVFPYSGEPTLANYLVNRFYSHRPDYLLDLMNRGEVVSDDGTPLPVSAPFMGGQSIWYYRELGPEPNLPSDLPILFEDEWILAVDKPHFLPTTPRGMFAAQTALVKLRVSQQNPDLSPIHRLDRATAGVLVFAKTRPARGPLQTMFQRGQVHKIYEAVARPIPHLAPGRRIRVRSYIEKQRSVVQVVQLSTADCHQLKIVPNAESFLETLTLFSTPERFPASGHHNRQLRFPRPKETLAHFLLLPRTGKTHQLRSHMNLLGSPILGDTVYPDLIHRAADEPALPLQLLARSLSFTHPMTGQNIQIKSHRQLSLLNPPAAILNIP